MVRKQRVIAVSILLALSLMLSLTPLSFAAGGGPGFHPLFSNLAKQNQRSLQAAGEARAPQGMTPVATGLNSPRGLAIGPDGGLYVAEGGTGGAACYPGLDPRDPNCHHLCRRHRLGHTHRERPTSAYCHRPALYGRSGWLCRIGSPAHLLAATRRVLGHHRPGDGPRRA